ncbi:hypothetical protein [Nocardia asteroides]|uniref:hypothetical protein n=1 Tax=Nocardia asteroides TaxID=1824 RepID=UPI001E3775C4|nr:hypothetical protein [Nocardia asteroides]UGT58332.1 hypothetical protein LTT85_16465 [Nocardia asteroides]
MNTQTRNRKANKESRDYREALREAANRRAREFDRQAATAPWWEGDGSDVWF